MTTIVSPHNPRLKALRRLQTRRGRAAEGRFVVEGEDLVAAAQAAGREPIEGYRLEGVEIGGGGGENFHDVERSALASVSTLGSSTRVMAVYEQRWDQAQGPLCVYLHGVGDPGNVGTVLRSAAAFAASCVVLGPKCADPHSPKAVRASMGAIFAVPLARVSDVRELPGERIALDASAEEPLRGPMNVDVDAATDAPEKAAVTLLVGAEREGLPAEVLAACERIVSIPIASESLNAAMAATVALYEMTRRGSRDIDSVRAS
jgi:RNA methyltransferase, TrmH family